MKMESMTPTCLSMLHNGQVNMISIQVGCTLYSCAHVVDASYTQQLDCFTHKLGSSYSMSNNSNSETTPTSVKTFFPAQNKRSFVGALGNDVADEENSDEDLSMDGTERYTSTTESQGDEKNVCLMLCYYENLW